MVMADRNNIEARSGRRSRGPSPNGHISDDSSATEDSDHDNGMRVGEDFQARIPLFTPDSKPDPKAEAMLVWAPHPELSECKINEYISLAKEKHGYNTEQALGMLFWHKHNVDKALTDLPNFTPFPDEWTVEDKVLFEQAFSFHGKSFHRIRQMLPDKSIASLVKYYYSWKKTRSRTSLMDRQARKLAGPRDFSEGEGSGESDSDPEVTKENGQREIKAGIQQNANSILRPSMAKRSDPRHNPMKNKRRPPRGMHLKTEDLIPLSTGPPGQGEAILKQLEAELVSLKREVQNNKQEISLNKQKAVASIDRFRPTEAPLKLTSKWSNEELLLAVQGIRKYGKDFGAIAEVIGNKTEVHVRSFFSNYRRRYNLDEVLQEYEAEHGNDGSTGEDVEKMEVDMKPESESVNGHSSESNGTPTPPPLLKQSGCAPSPLEVQVPTQQPTRMTLAPSSNPSLLQQPPPLVKPQLLNSQPNKSHKPTLLPSKN